MHVRFRNDGRCQRAIEVVAVSTVKRVVLQPQQAHSNEPVARLSPHHQVRPRNLGDRARLGSEGIRGDCTMATQYPSAATKPLAVVTGASSGIGRELAIEAAQRGFDLIIAADTPLHETCAELTSLGAQVEAVEDDLATPAGVDRLCDAIGERPVAALLANAGHGLGRSWIRTSRTSTT
jgi:hypothetical protein